MGILLFLALILSLRAVVTLSYSDTLSLSVRVLFVKIPILPKKNGGKRVRSMSRKQSEQLKKKLAAKEEKKRLKKQKKKEDKDAQKEQQGGKKRSLKDIVDTVDLALLLVKTALGHFFGHLRVDVARFRITVATPDPATTAVAYGAVAQTLSYIEAILASNKNVRGLSRADIALSCDFLAEAPSADIKLRFSLRVWHALHIALATFIKLIKNKFKKMDAQIPQETK